MGQDEVYRGAAGAEHVQSAGQIGFNHTKLRPTSFTYKVSLLHLPRQTRPVWGASKELGQCACDGRNLTCASTCRSPPGRGSTDAQKHVSIPPDQRLQQKYRTHSVRGSYIVSCVAPQQGFLGVRLRTCPGGHHPRTPGAAVGGHAPAGGHQPPVCSPPLREKQKPTSGAYRMVFFSSRSGPGGDSLSCSMQNSACLQGWVRNSKAAPLSKVARGGGSRASRWCCWTTGRQQVGYSDDCRPLQ